MLRTAAFDGLYPRAHSAALYQPSSEKLLEPMSRFVGVEVHEVVAQEAWRGRGDD